MTDLNRLEDTPQDIHKNMPNDAEPFPESAASTTVNGEDLSSELQVPRKREREISLEPATPQSTTTDLDTGRKEARAPIKKNKLDSTEEEQDPPPESSAATPTHSRSGSPSRPGPVPMAAEISTSPPIETKVRHISRRVSDIHWHNEDTPRLEMDVQVDPGQGTPEALEAAVEIGQVPGYVQPASAPVDVDIAAETAEMAGDVDGNDDDQVKPRRLSTDSVTGKRPREEADKDANPRETKRPSPPPEPVKGQETPVAQKTSSSQANATPKLGGFMSYASSSSPFASVNGTNVFGSSNKPKPTFGSPSPFSPATKSAFSSLGDTSSSCTPPPSTPNTRVASPTPSTSALFQSSGFAAFASTASPFAPVARPRSPSSGPSRPKSPAGGKNKSPYADRAKSPMGRAHAKSSSAFTSYASGGAQGFGVPSPLATPVSKRARAGTPAGPPKSSGTQDSGSGEDSPPTEPEEETPSPKGKRSFGEVLRAGKDGHEEEEEEAAKEVLSAQELQTGEEGEQTLYQVRGKLFTLASGNQWKERGTGMLRLNVLRSDGTSPRLVMRKEAVYSLLLNITLFKGMHFALAQDPRYLRFSAIEDGQTTHYNLRVSNAKIAAELLEEINSNVPT